MAIAPIASSSAVPVTRTGGAAAPAGQHPAGFGAGSAVPSVPGSALSKFPEPLLPEGPRAGAPRAPQRAAAPASSAPQAAPDLPEATATAPGTVPFGPPQPTPPDLPALADHVYGLLVRRLRSDRERRGW
ncbi:hypothetical protein BJY16_007537 [Actinoplanes octamycinicus]|uniref:Uncharacterized protein n=1 Tax=Actinoplanes octamycinicus TaxID=135948 RepID=A0A7W7MBG3_9ACTN|nr:hypothetical protein [Actinoplanes octamycinicus]MBB4744078.1 hypothetical protein [Actinoplanes octamycinicus]